MPSIRNRKYDLIVLGATGYTGKLCAEHITTSLPTTLYWAVAGRSESKLSAVVDDLKTLNSDRVQPGKDGNSLHVGLNSCSVRHRDR